MRIAALLLFTAVCSTAYAEVISGASVRVNVTSAAETVETRDGSRWAPAFSTTGAVTRTVPGGFCRVVSVTAAD